MGLKFLHEFARSQRQQVPIEYFRNTCVAVDISVYLHRYLSSSSSYLAPHHRNVHPHKIPMRDRWIGVVRRVVNKLLLLVQYDILPLVIFDARFSTNVLKLSENISRQAAKTKRANIVHEEWCSGARDAAHRAFDATLGVEHDLIILLHSQLTLLNIPYIFSPTEADLQINWCILQKMCVGAISIDTDLLMHGILLIDPSLGSLSRNEINAPHLQNTASASFTLKHSPLTSPNPSFRQNNNPPTTPHFNHSNESYRTIKSTPLYFECIDGSNIALFITNKLQQFELGTHHYSSKNLPHTKMQKNTFIDIDDENDHDTRLNQAHDIVYDLNPTIGILEEDDNPFFPLVDEPPNTTPFSDTGDGLISPTSPSMLVNLNQSGTAMTELSYYATYETYFHYFERDYDNTRLKSNANRHMSVLHSINILNFTILQRAAYFRQLFKNIVTDPESSSCKVALPSDIMIPPEVYANYRILRLFQQAQQESILAREHHNFLEHFKLCYNWDLRRTLYDSHKDQPVDNLSGSLHSPDKDQHVEEEKNHHDTYDIPKKYNPPQPNSPSSQKPQIVLCGIMGNSYEQHFPSTLGPHKQHSLYPQSSSNPSLFSFLTNKEPLYSLSSHYTISPSTLLLQMYSVLSGCDYFPGYVGSHHATTDPSSSAKSKTNNNSSNESTSSSFSTTLTRYTAIIVNTIIGSNYLHSSGCLSTMQLNLKSRCFERYLCDNLYNIVILSNFIHFLIKFPHLTHVDGDREDVGHEPSTIDETCSQKYGFSYQLPVMTIIPTISTMNNLTKWDPKSSDNEKNITTGQSPLICPTKDKTCQNRIITSLGKRLNNRSNPAFTPPQNDNVSDIATTAYDTSSYHYIDPASQSQIQHTTNIAHTFASFEKLINYYPCPLILLYLSYNIALQVIKHKFVSSLTVPQSKLSTNSCHNSNPSFELPHECLTPSYEDVYGIYRSLLTWCFGPAFHCTNGNDLDVNRKNDHQTPHFSSFLSSVVKRLQPVPPLMSMMATLIKNKVAHNLQTSSTQKNFLVQQCNLTFCAGFYNGFYNFINKHNFDDLINLRSRYSTYINQYVLNDPMFNAFNDENRLLSVTKDYSPLIKLLQSEREKKKSKKGKKKDGGRFTDEISLPFDSDHSYNIASCLLQDYTNLEIKIAKKLQRTVSPSNDTFSHTSQINDNISHQLNAIHFDHTLQKSDTIFVHNYNISNPNLEYIQEEQNIQGIIDEIHNINGYDGSFLPKHRETSQKESFCLHQHEFCPTNTVYSPGGQLFISTIPYHYISEKAQSEYVLLQNYLDIPMTSLNLLDNLGANVMQSPFVFSRISDKQVGTKYIRLYTNQPAVLTMMITALNVFLKIYKISNTHQERDGDTVINIFTPPKPPRLQLTQNKIYFTPQKIRTPPQKGKTHFQSPNRKPVLKCSPFINFPFNLTTYTCKLHPMSNIPVIPREGADHLPTFTLPPSPNTTQYSIPCQQVFVPDDQDGRLYGGSTATPPPRHAPVINSDIPYYYQYQIHTQYSQPNVDIMMNDEVSSVSNQFLVDIQIISRANEIGNTSTNALFPDWIQELYPEVTTLNEHNDGKQSHNAASLFNLNHVLYSTMINVLYYCPPSAMNLQPISELNTPQSSVPVSADPIPSLQSHTVLVPKYTHNQSYIFKRFGSPPSHPPQYLQNPHKLQQVYLSTLYAPFLGLLFHPLQFPTNFRRNFINLSFSCLMRSISQFSIHPCFGCDVIINANPATTCAKYSQTKNYCQWDWNNLVNNGNCPHTCSNQYNPSYLAFMQDDLMLTLQHYQHYDHNDIDDDHESFDGLAPFLPHSTSELSSNVREHDHPYSIFPPSSSQDDSLHNAIDLGANVACFETKSLEKATLTANLPYATTSLRKIASLSELNAKKTPQSSKFVPIMNGHASNSEMGSSNPVKHQQVDYNNDNGDVKNHNNRRPRMNLTHTKSACIFQANTILDLDHDGGECGDNGYREIKKTKK